MSQQFKGFAGTERYLPVRLLGAGGMGAVYEAEDRRTGGRVALKVMLADDAAHLLRFKQEFRVVAELHHPNLVRFFDLGQHEGQWFFTMELVHGQDLLEVLLEDRGGRAATLTETRAAAPAALIAQGGGPTCDATLAFQPGPVCDPEAFAPAIAQLLDALEFLHQRGIVHRDLKPSNILVDERGVVRVLDFGLASRAGSTLSISQDGALVGTLSYMAPEQVRGEQATPSSDLYALGAMMFQLLTGGLPWPGRGMEGVFARCERAPPRVEERVPGVPRALADVVARLMAREPAARASLAEVRDALGTGPARAATRPVSTFGQDSVDGIFVGRQRELGVLDGCVEQAARGQAQLALVAGPSGIGKSALASVLLRRAERRGFLCLRGRCYEREQVPFVAFDRLMDQLVLTLRGWPRPRLDPLGPALTALSRIFPAFALLTGRGADTIGGDPRELRQQAIDGFLRIADVLAASSPVCFLLDDLQWADEESVELLSALIAGNAGRVLLLGLFQAEPVREGHPLAGLLGAASAGGRATRLDLLALDVDDAARLVEAVIGSSLEQEMSAAISAQTGGNPFLVRRLADHLTALDPLRRAERLDVAASTGDLIRDMIRALPPRAEQVLSLAATAGGDVAAAILRETSGLGGEDFDLAVGELSAARLLKAVPRGPDARAHLDVYHDRIRNIVYQGLGDDRRRALHGALARAIEAAGGDREAESLARHFGFAGDHAARRRYALLAAEQAAEKLAFAHAARLFHDVLDDADPAEPPALVAARWERVGDLLEYAGQHLAAARAYQQALRRVESTASPDAAPRLRLRGLAGVNLMATEHVEEGRALFAEGLALLGLPFERPLPERLAVIAALKAQNALAERFPQLAARRATPLTPAEVRFLDLMVRAFQPLWPLPTAEAAERAELLGRRVDDQLVLFRSAAFGAAVSVIVGRASPEELSRSHARLDHADHVARRQEIPLGRELVQANRGLLWLASDFPRARRACDAAKTAIARRGMLDSYDGVVARMFAMYVLFARGDDDDALAAMSAEIERPHPNFVNAGWARCLSVIVHARRGRLREAAEMLRSAQGSLAGMRSSRLHVLLARAEGTLHNAEGRHAEVLAMGERVERMGRSIGSWNVGSDRGGWTLVALDAALAALKQGALEAAARRRARADAAWLTEGGVFDYTCLGHRALALLDHADGKTRPALRALRIALATSSSNTCPYHRWLCLGAAKEMGRINLDEESELLEIGAERGFVA